MFSPPINFSSNGDLLIDDLILGNTENGEDCANNLVDFKKENTI